MKTIEKMLDPGEEIRVLGVPSPIACYGVMIFVIVVGLAFAIAIASSGAVTTAILFLLGWTAFFAVLAVPSGWARQTSTAIAVTDRRVLAATGLVRRQTSELMLDRVEGFAVDEGMLGRVFGYGTVAVNGVGTGRVTVPGIRSPFDFRRDAQARLAGNSA